MLFCRRLFAPTTPAHNLCAAVFNWVLFFFPFFPPLLAHWSPPEHICTRLLSYALSPLDTLHYAECACGFPLPMCRPATPAISSHPFGRRTNKPARQRGSSLPVVLFLPCLAARLHANSPPAHFMRPGVVMRRGAPQHSTSARPLDTRTHTAPPLQMPTNDPYCQTLAAPHRYRYGRARHGPFAQPRCPPLLHSMNVCCWSLLFICVGVPMMGTRGHPRAIISPQPLPPCLADSRSTQQSADIVLLSSLGGKRACMHACMRACACGSAPCHPNQAPRAAAAAHSAPPTTDCMPRPAVPCHAMPLFPSAYIHRAIGPVPVPVLPMGAPGEIQPVPHPPTHLPCDAALFSRALPLTGMPVSIPRPQPSVCAATATAALCWGARYTHHHHTHTQHHTRMPSATRPTPARL